MTGRIHKRSYGKNHINQAGETAVRSRRLNLALRRDSSVALTARQGEPACGVVLGDHSLKASTCKCPKRGFYGPEETS